MAQPLHTLPVRVDFTCYRGDDWTRCFEPVEINPAANTAIPTDMTGWTGRMQIRAAVDGPILLEASTANGRITTGPQNNGQGTTWQLMVYLSASDTRLLPAGLVGRCDIELTRPDGSKQTYYFGDFCVEGDITV